MRRYRWLWIVLLLALALPPWGRWAPRWLTTLALPGRQTVPITPPATWTPAQPPPTVTPLPTRPGGSRTHTPIPAPTEAPPTVTLAPGQTPSPSPTGALTATAVGDATPTSASASPTGAPALGATPGLWLWLHADPAIVGPGSRALLQVEVANEGPQAIAEAVVALSGLTPLTLAPPRPSAGQVEAQPGLLLWRVGALAPGAGAALELDVVVSDLVLPDGALPLRAALTWRGGGPLVQEIALALPWAPLPAVGK